MASGESSSQGCAVTTAPHSTREVVTMKVKAGDVLACQCDDCDLELTVTKACKDDACDACSCSDVDVSCCGKPMVVKTSTCGCGCKE